MADPTDDQIDASLALEGFNAAERYPEYGHEALQTAYRAGWEDASAALAAMEARAVAAEAARDEFAERLSHLLCDLTGSRLSKPTYPVQTMAQEIEEYLTADLNAALAERGVEVARLRERLSTSEAARVSLECDLEKARESGRERRDIDAGTVGRLRRERDEALAKVAEAKAEAWDEGYGKGAADHCDFDDCDTAGENPYRAAREVTKAQRQGGQSVPQQSGWGQPAQQPWGPPATEPAPF